jgi:hypothetical protein
MITNNHLFKPECRLVGENGNIFNLMAIVKRTLEDVADDGEELKMRREQSSEMISRVTSSKSYDEALAVLADYVEIY